ncbi:MAG: hypothetical protein VKJ46_08435 [Leptolyngbyaceae bacterium]|nr:hypothetical protein [Leptolyngbyaceae bacterium]
MWHKLKSIAFHLSTYADLAPDLRLRRQVNQSLHTRPSLASEEWYDYFWRPRKISHEISTFVYTHLEQYSGLQVSRVLPSDRLDEDLKMTLVCWFDWNLTLCEDFQHCFAVDISDRLDINTLSTVEDFVLFLNHQLLLLKR